MYQTWKGVRSMPKKPNQELEKQRERIGYIQKVTDLMFRITDPDYLFKIYHFALANYRWEQKGKGGGKERKKNTI